MFWFRFLLLFILAGHFATAQSIYYVSPNKVDVVDHKYNFGVFDIANCTDSIIFELKNPLYLDRIRDIALCPNGEFYLAVEDGTPPYVQLCKIDFQDSSIVMVAAMNSGVGMVCDNNGVLWMAPYLASYDTKNGDIRDDYGLIGNFDIAGDMTFINGELYGVTSQNQLIKIDTSNVLNTHVVYEFDLPGSNAWGLVSEVISCDSTVTYMATTNAFVSSTIDSLNAIYSIDPVNQNITLLCDRIPPAMLGTTSASEFLASDCTVRLDLDADDSSGAMGADWNSPLLCGAQQLVLHDTDFVWHSGYFTDSITVRLLTPVPDGPNEFLTATGLGAVAISGSGAQSMTMYRQGQTTLPNTNLDFSAALKSINYVNAASAPQAGVRTIEIIAYVSGNRRDTAFAFVNFAPLPYAGIDTVFQICSNSAPFQLFAPNGAAGGAWPAGGDIFDPQQHSSGVFQYVVENGVCPADTAAVEVIVTPAPVFSLGDDVQTCENQSVTLSVPGAAVTWPDGSVSNNYLAQLPGWNWAEQTDGNGCVYRDSILINWTPATSGETVVQQCSGNPYAWNGLSLTNDTLISLVLTAASGCDSIDMLDLSFFTPEIQIDSVICAGKSISWNNQVLQNTGVYEAQLFINGCLTNATLNLQIEAPDSVYQLVQICAGETYSIGGQTFGASGNYALNQLDTEGCLEVLQLDLVVHPPAAAQLERFICPGDSFMFNGLAVSVPGIYDASLTGQFGCDSLVTLTLNHFSEPLKPVITGDSVLCHGDMAHLAVTNAGNNQIQWSTGQNMADIQVQSAGAYAVTVSDANGCSASSAFELVLIDPVTAVLDTLTPICAGQSNGVITLSGLQGGLQPLQFQLNGGPWVDEPAFHDLSAGQYAIGVLDAAGCKTTLLAHLSDPPVLEIDPGPDQSIAPGESFQIIPAIYPAGSQLEYSWSPPEGLSCVECPNPVAAPADSTYYTLTIRDNNGCEQTAGIWIFVRPGEGVFVPQIFSPNGDGTNDAFMVFGDLSKISRVKVFQIYDRWGEKLYDGRNLTPNDESSGWDGRLNGREMTPGVYVWYLEVEFINGATLVKKGDITLVR